MLKNILGIVVGLAVAIALTMGVQAISIAMYPMPATLNPSDSQALGKWIGSLPTLAFLILILSNLLASFCGCLTATWISQAFPTPAYIVAGVLTLFAAVNAISIPQPLWVSVACLIGILPAGLAGAKFVQWLSATQQP